MSRYHQDDGTFGDGLLAALAILAAFLTGYGMRDCGFVIHINQPAPEVRQ